MTGLESSRGDMESVELDEYEGLFVADDVETNNGDVKHKADPGNCFDTKDGVEKELPTTLKLRFKQDVGASKEFEPKLAVSSLGLTDTRFSLACDCDINGGKATSEWVVGDNEERVDEWDDKGDSIPFPSSSMELFSSVTHSRSSSNIPSNIESNVNGIILATFTCFTNV